MQRCHANPQNPQFRPPIARIRAREIVSKGHPLPKCLEGIELPADVKAKAMANSTTPAKTVTYAQVAEGAETLETYMATGEMNFEEAIQAAVESSLGVGVEDIPPTTEAATQPEQGTTIQTLAFIDQDDAYQGEADFCTTSRSREQL